MCFRDVVCTLFSLDFLSFQDVDSCSTFSRVHCERSRAQNVIERSQRVILGGALEWAAVRVVPMTADLVLSFCHLF